MKSILLILILLAMGVWLGIAIHSDSGYVLIAYHNWSIESSIWVALCTTLILFIIIYSILRLLIRTSNLSNRLRNWSGSKKQKNAQKLTQNGLCALAEGHWKKALDALEKSARHYPTPLINYLASARAAQELQDYELRDNLLRKAAKSTRGTELAIGLTQAQLQIAAKQWEQALATLRHLHYLQPRHCYTLKLLYSVYLKLEDWSNLKKLLDPLKKYKALPKQSADHARKTNIPGAN